MPTAAVQQFTLNRGGSDASDPRGYSRNGKERLSLSGMAKRNQWPTPSLAMNSGYASDEKRDRPTSTGNRAGHRGNELLRRVHRAGPWPTPTVTGNNNRAGMSEKSGDGLATAVNKAARLGVPKGDGLSGERPGAPPVRPALWPTPRASDSRGPGRAATCQGGDNLTTAVNRWPTPQARDWKGPRGKHTKGGRDLPSEVEKFPTPTTRDWRHPGPSSYARNSPCLNAQVGGPLNPVFVEWLMGFPPGWTGLEPVGTGSYRRWLLEHSQSSRCAPPTSPGPVVRVREHVYLITPQGVER